MRSGNLPILSPQPTNLNNNHAPLLSQTKAITCTGIHLIFAGPGSGQTRVITEKILLYAFILREQQKTIEYKKTT